MTNWIKSNWVLLAIIFIAIVFRFWQIQSLPAGLFPDEAAYGMDARSITRGEFQPFFERGNGREGLFMYFLALAISVFGYHPWANHLVSASFGLAAVIAAYFLTKKIFDKQTALLAAFLMAVSSYAVTMTRTAFRANTVPLLGTLTLLFLIKAFTDTEEKSRTRSAAISGLFFALGFYTYISYRMILPLLVCFLAVMCFARRGQLRLAWTEYKNRVFAFIIAFVLVFSWIGYYWFVQHPGTFVGRAGQVSIFSKDLNNGDVVGTFKQVLKKTAMGYFTSGDLNWRHNVSGQPFLTPLVSPMFGITLLAFTWCGVVLLKQAWRRSIKQATLLRALLAAWFLLMLVPEITTAEGIPHGLRLIGTLPVIFILAARGTIWTWRKISQQLLYYRFRSTFAAIFLATLFVYNFTLYFNVAANSPEYYYAFRSDLTAVSDYINLRNNKTKTYLALDEFSVQTVDYLTTPSGQAYTLLVPEKSHLQQLNPGDEIIFTQSTLPDATRFKATHPNAKQLVVNQNKFGGTTMIVLRQP